ncbi:MAG: hypothetical protein USCAAHI_01427 [Beijerinckiaceae bacterium]|nr:MAG: hypothetical protein USCAAHI_01427 [Beijerinckiaceae bacterium]
MIAAVTLPLLSIVRLGDIANLVFGSIINIALTSEVSQWFVECDDISAKVRPPARARTDTD